MSPRVLTERGLTMLDDLPPFLAQDPDIRGITDVIAREVQRIEDAAENLRRNFFPAQGEDFLRFWESVFGLSVDPTDQTLAQRRTRILNHTTKLGRTGSGEDWVEAVTNAIGTDWSHKEHLPANARAANQVTNPGAEVDLAGISGSSGTVVRTTADARHGAASAELSWVTQGAASVYFGFTASTEARRIQVTPGTYYIVRASAKLVSQDDPSGTAVYQRIRFFDSAGVSMGDWLIVPDTITTPATTGVWVDAEFLMTPPAGAAYMLLYAAYVDPISTGSGVARVDRAQVTPVSAPPYTVLFQDPFTDPDLNGRYFDINGGSPNASFSASGDRLILATDVARAIRHRTVSARNAIASAKIHTGADVSAFTIGTLLRGIDGSNYILTRVANGASGLRASKRVTGTLVDFRTGNYTLLANTTYTLRTILYDTKLVVELWEGDVNTGTLRQVLFHHMNATDAATFTNAGFIGLYVDLPPPYDTAVLADVPALFWNTISPAVATDASGNARNGTVNGSPPTVLSPVAETDGDTGVDLDGTDDYITSSYRPFIRPNENTNPSFETDASGWASFVTSPGTVTAVTRVADAPTGGGSWCGEATATGQPNAGLFVIFREQNTGPAHVAAGERVWLRGSAKLQAGVVGATGRLQLIARYYNSAGAYLTEAGLSEQVNPTVGTWYDLSGSHVAPANAAYVNVEIGLENNSGAAQNTTLRVDRALVVVTDASPAYFDGDTPGYGWSGTAHLSTSHSIRTFEGWAWRDVQGHNTLFGGDGVNHPFLRVTALTKDVLFQLSNTDAGAGSMSWAGAWPDTGQWVLWEFTYNDATDTGELFINGVSKGTRTFAGAKYGPVPGNLKVGARGAAAFESWDGRVAKVAVYEGALSAARIKAHYDAQAAARDWWIDDLEVSSIGNWTLPLYFDGGTAGYMWDGTAHNSRSYPTYPAAHVVSITIPFVPGSAVASEMEKLLRAVTPAHIEIQFVYSSGFIIGYSGLGDPL